MIGIQLQALTARGNPQPYTGVKILEVHPTGIRILHDGGISRVAFEHLPHELRRRARFDPLEAEAFRAKQRKQQGQSREQQEASNTQQMQSSAQIATAPVIVEIPGDEMRLHKLIETELVRINRIRAEIRGADALLSRSRFRSARSRSTVKLKRKLELMKSEHEQRIADYRRMLAERESTRRKLLGLRQLEEARRARQASAATRPRR